MDHWQRMQGALLAVSALVSRSDGIAVKTARKCPYGPTVTLPMHVASGEVQIWQMKPRSP
jgi:hypothetical protein